MTDDIVTRLRGEANRLRFVASGTSLVVVSPSLQDEAANEIERLRNAIIKIDRAIKDEGKVPSYHRAILKKHRGEWPTLHNAIDEAILVVRGE